MPLPVTVYRWDDPGAPQLTNHTPSALIDLLKKVLVTGYGTKPGLGWTIAFEDVANRKIAFRNSPALASGGYVQFWNPEATDTTSSRLAYRTAQGMSALDAFVKAGRIANIKGANTQQAHWMIIGTAAGFYFIGMEHTVTTYDKGRYSVFIGDFHSAVANDQGRMTSTTSGSDHTSGVPPTIIMSQSDSSIGMSNLLYPTDGGTSSLTAARVLVGGSAISAAHSRNESDTALGISPGYSPACIRPSANSSTDAAGTPVNSSLLQPFNRGYFPGLYISSFAGFKTVPFANNISRSIGGKNHILVPGESTFGACAWVNTEEWY